MLTFAAAVRPLLGTPGPGVLSTAGTMAALRQVLMVAATLATFTVALVANLNQSGATP
jgi:hypothetical protein